MFFMEPGSTLVKTTHPPVPRAAYKTGANLLSASLRRAGGGSNETDDAPPETKDPSRGDTSDQPFHLLEALWKA